MGEGRGKVELNASFKNVILQKNIIFKCSMKTNSKSCVQADPAFESDGGFTSARSNTRFPDIFFLVKGHSEPWQNPSIFKNPEI